MTVDDILRLRTAGALRVVQGQDIVEFAPGAAPRVEVEGQPPGGVQRHEVPEDLLPLLFLSPEDRAKRIVAAGEKKLPVEEYEEFEQWVRYNRALV